MTAPSAKIIVPEVIDRFRAYYLANPDWGSLHIVLEDFNIQDIHVDWCITRAEKIGDVEGLELAKILLTMSKSQRLKISKLA